MGFIMPAWIARYAKFYVALLSALITVVIQFYPAVHWLSAISAILGALAVYVTPNTP
jgi:hypothetical protein